MSEMDRRSAKLHKQNEVDDDSEEGTQTAPHSTTTSTIASQSSGVLCKNLYNIPGPSIVPDSNYSSETSLEDPTPKPTQLPVTTSRKQTLTRTPAFEGTSPPPESFLVHHNSLSDKPSSSSTTTTILSSGNGTRSIIPSISTTSPPLVTTSTHPLPNGGTVTVNTLSVTPGTVFASTSGRTKGTSAAHQAKEFMLSSHTVSNDSGRGTLDDGSDIPRESSVDTSFNLATAVTSSLLTSAATSTSSSSTSLSTPSSAILPLAYTDSTGTDLIPFFKSTLQKSAKDKKTLLAVEKEIMAFIEDQGSLSHKMNEMNPYDRMVAHRVAAYYGLDHNVDQSGKCIIVTRTSKTRMPDVKLCDMPNTLEEKRILLKKPSSLDEQQVKCLTTKDKFGTNRAKSLEERQQNYHEVRERIFKVEESPLGGKEGQSTSFLSGNLLQHPSFQHHHHHHPPISQQRSLDSMRDARQQQQQLCTLHPHLHQHQSFSHPLWSSTESSGYGMHQQALQDVDFQQQHQLGLYKSTQLPSPPPSPPSCSAGGHQYLSTPIATSLSAHILLNGLSGQHPSVLAASSSSISGIDINANSVSEIGASVSVSSVTAAIAVNQPLTHQQQQQQQQQQRGFHFNPYHQCFPTAAATNLLSARGFKSESIGGPSLYESPPSDPPTQELSDTPTGSARDQSPVSRPTSETGQSPLTQFSQYPTMTYLVSTDVALKPSGSCIINPETTPPHASPDGSLNQYDVSCPPSIMMATSQQTTTSHISTASFVYQADPLYNQTSVTPVDCLIAGGLDQTNLGQTVSVLQSPGQPSNFIQTQYLNGSQTTVQPVRYIYCLPSTGCGGSVGSSIHQHLTTTPTTALDSNTHNHSLHQRHHPHQVTTVVHVPPTAASPVIPPVVNPTGDGGGGIRGSYQIIHHPTAYVQTASGVNVGVAPISASSTGIVGSSIPIDISSVTQEQQGVLATGGGSVLCHPSLPHQTLVNHPQSITTGGGVPTHPPAAAAIPISAPNVIQAYTITPYHLTNVAALPITQQQEQYHQQSPLSHPPQHHVQNQYSSIVSSTAIPPFNNLSSIPPDASQSPATFFTEVPLTSTNSSPFQLSQHLQHLPQPPPHQLHQPAMVLNIGVPMLSTLAPTTSSLSLPPPSFLSSKSNLTTGTSSAGRFSTPPPPPPSLSHQRTPPPYAPTMQSSYHYNTQQKQPPPPHHQQHQPSSLSSNGYHHNQSHHRHNSLQVPTSYSHSQSAITLIPNQSLSSQQHTTQQGGSVGNGGSSPPQLVTISNPPGGSSYHPQFRPYGTIVPMPGVPELPSAVTSVPTLQVIRPTVPIQDFRMLQPGAFHHPRLSSVSLYGPLMYHQGRLRSRSGNRSKKYGSHDLGNGQDSGIVQQLQQRKKENPLSQQQSSFAPPPPQQLQQQVLGFDDQATCVNAFHSPHLPPTSCW